MVQVFGGRSPGAFGGYIKRIASLIFNGTVPELSELHTGVANARVTAYAGMQIGAGHCLDAHHKTISIGGHVGADGQRRQNDLA